MIGYIKKISSVVFFSVFLSLFSFYANNSLASGCNNYGGATTYCDDGTSYNDYGQGTTYGSDGTSYSNYGGSTTYGSDGTSQSNYGQGTTYGSDGTSYSNYGGSTTYGSDGSTFNDYGGSTTYGSGSGKMIKIPNHKKDLDRKDNTAIFGSDSDGSTYNNYGGATTYGGDGSTQSNYGGSATFGGGHSNDNYEDTNTYGSGEKILERNSPTNQRDDGDTTISGNDGSTVSDTNGSDYNLEEPRKRRAIDREMCPLNAVYISSIKKCECIFRYKYDGLSCVYNGSSDNPTIEIEPIKKSNSAQSLDVNSDNQNVPAINKTNSKEKVFVWWNPLTWWGYFFNKSIPVVNDKIELTKSIKDEAPTPSLEWKEYSSDIGKFTALYPYDVIHGNWMDSATMKKLGWVGINKIDTFSTTGTNAESFSVWFHQYVDQRSVTNKTTLQTSLDNLLKLMKNYKLISSDYSKNGEYEALDYLIFNKGENKYEKGKFIAVKQNIYQIFVDYKGEYFNTVDTMKFFESFRVQ